MTKSPTRKVKKSKIHKKTSKPRRKSPTKRKASPKRTYVRRKTSPRRNNRRKASPKNTYVSRSTIPQRIHSSTQVISETGQDQVSYVPYKKDSYDPVPITTEEIIEKLSDDGYIQNTAPKIEDESKHQPRGFDEHDMFYPSYLDKMIVKDGQDGVDCTQGRVNKVGAKCYIIAVVNGFILSSRLRRDVFGKIKKSNSDTLRYIKSDITKCVDRPQTETEFLHIFYNSLCKGVENITSGDMKTAQDIVIKSAFSDYSLKFSSMVSSMLILRKIMDWVYGGSNMIQYLDKYQYRRIIVNNEIPVLSVAYNQNTFKKIPISMKYKNTTYSHDYVYSLEFAVIYISYYSEYGNYVDEYKAKIATKDLCGVRCNGKYLLYDTPNKFFEINWTDMNDQNMEPVFSRYGKPVKYFIYSSVYVRDDREYNTKSVKELCDELD